MSENHKHTNRLIKETSPYLLQHAHNPVDWYPWCGEAFAKAIKENKPVLVSIGYSACHWCHVMERESFEVEETARIMNENFVNIKIDREERPDIDHIYMDAVQAITGSGGWPLNVFLTPEKKPFYGGTYFPPVRAYNRASWKEVLLAISDSFKTKRHEINAQAENLTEHLQNANAFGLQKINAGENQLNREKVDEIFRNLVKSADKQWGGFSRAPKFPQTFSIQYLLRYAHHYKNEEALKLAALSLDKMMQGGIYDHIGGGFARYSTDTEWLVPHFEKMLYDNALLVSVYCEAYQLTKNEQYKKLIDETIGFIRRELMDENYGFYSALDADSEGVEGKFYVWAKEEIENLLDQDEELFCKYYNVSEKGNFEHSNILNTRKDAEVFSKEENVSSKEFDEIMNRSKKILLEERDKRIRPGLDDKIILGWNALMNTALSKAYAATGNETYRQLALDNMSFLVRVFRNENNKSLYHTWKNNESKYPAFLDDYACIIEALIHLQEISSDVKWLMTANELTEFVIENFSEEETGFFFYTEKSQADVIVRKKEVYDGATPSGNAVMALNLHRLSIYFDKPEWKKRSVTVLGSVTSAVTKYPVSFACWAGLLLEVATGTNEIAIVGKGFQHLHKEILSIYLPNRIIMASEKPLNEFPVLAGKETSTEPAVFLCRDYACRQPVYSAKSFVELLLTS